MLIQYLIARHNFRVFHPKLHNQTIYFFVLDLTQLTISKMDNFFLLQIIETVPELMFKYMGSYPSDKVPQLTNYSFPTINSAPSKERGEHRIMIARLYYYESYYYADSLGRKRSNYPFLTKKFRRMVPRKPQKTDNLCEFCAISSAFLLFIFFQKIMINVHDVVVSNFISNFI